MNILCVCTANQNRSPTAEKILEKDYQNVEARSAGIHPDAHTEVNQRLLDWADKIFVMDEVNDHHKTFLYENFKVDENKIINLRIPDIYLRNDPELVSILKKKMKPHIKI